MSPAEAFVSVFLLFCRIGACLMIMPGFSSPRMPVRARLFAAIAITLALAPSLVEAIGQSAKALSSAGLVIAILRESIVGGTIGLLGRILFASLETLCTAVAMAVGFGNAFGVRIDEGDSLPELASLIMLGAVTLFFVTDQHAQVVRALAASYEAVPFGAIVDPRESLVQVVDMLTRGFLLALRITSPFVLYGLLVNFAFGLLNRLVPQIQVYFISTPFVIAGGLAILYAIAGVILTLFSDGMRQWLVRG